MFSHVGFNWFKERHYNEDENLCQWLGLRESGNLVDPNDEDKATCMSRFCAMFSVFLLTRKWLFSIYFVTLSERSLLWNT